MPIVNLKQYDIVITTSFEFKYGVCGHLFEMIDYYYAIKTYTDLTPCILLSDGTTTEELQNAIQYKYQDLIVENVVEHKHPKVILANNILLVDGSPRLRNADIFADNLFMFRCSETDFSSLKFKGNKFMLQDFEIYDERYSDMTNIDYKKKILFDKYKHYANSVEDTAMFYLTSLCRALTTEQLESSIEKHKVSNYIVLTDTPEIYNNAYRIPLENMWDRFSTYIYTAIPRKMDCSSRFVLECLHYGKHVIFDIEYYDKALAVRCKDGLNGTSLKQDDAFLKLLNEQIKRKAN
jgi:hypothetical protein